MLIDEGGRQRSFRQSPASVIPPEPPPRRPVMRSINDSPSAQVMSQLDNQVIKGTMRSTKSKHVSCMPLALSPSYFYIIYVVYVLSSGSWLL